MSCTHLEDLPVTEPTTTEGCEDCLKIGGQWVHLRMCQGCGHVGCCDDSPNRHATAHFDGAGHPVVQSFEPGEHWAFCYVDDAVLEAVPGEIDRAYG